MATSTDTDPLKPALDAATGLTWTWDPEWWGYVDAGRRWFLEDHESGAYKLVERHNGQVIERFGWEWYKGGEGTSAYNERLSAKVAAVISATKTEAQPTL